MNDWLTHLLEALRRARIDFSPEDVADAVWLTQWLGEAPGFPAAHAEPRPSPTPEAPLRPAESKPTAPKPAAPEASAAKAEKPQHPGVTQASIHLPRRRKTGELGRGGKAFRSPSAPALPGILGLARALRPLMRRVPSRSRWVFDEAETVRRAVEEGIWVPALRPARDRWLNVALIVDAGSSMGVWRQAVQELRRLLEWMGAFRTVRVWALDTENNPPRLYAGLGRRDSTALGRNPRELVDPSGRSLVLLVTDCVSSAWHDGSAARLLETWSRHGPVALVQALPEHLWSRTALGSASLVRLSTPGAAVPNLRLQAQCLDDWPDASEPVGTPLPIATLEPTALASLARLVAGSGTVRTPGYRLDLEPLPRSTPAVESQSTAEVRVERFWQAASPLARRLAGLLAAAPAISLPVLRLIRQTLLPEARQVHEAEVLLGGLLHVVDTGDPRDPDEAHYDFHAGVRSRLLDVVPTASAVEVLERVSSYVQEHLASGLDFRAVLADPGAARGELVPDQSPFATIAAEVLQRLGGDYARLVSNLPAAASGAGTGAATITTTATAGLSVDGGALAAEAAPGTVTSTPASQPVQSYASSESLQHKLGRVRRPRVQISYEVDVGGAMQKAELPFVVGVIADLSGHAQESPMPLKQRRFLLIDRDNFNDVMRAVAPRLALRVSDPPAQSSSTVELRWTCMEDFEPDHIVQQVASLRDLRKQAVNSGWSVRVRRWPGFPVITPRQLERNREFIAEFDRRLTAQLNEIMHHPDFQRLEAAWRGLHYLVHQTETGENLKIRVLNISKRALFKDMERAVEFDQTTLYKIVCEEEYSQLGGQPFGLLVGDFEFGNHAEDKQFLSHISHVAAAAHAPFIGAASPQLFGLQGFAELGAVRDLAKIFQGVDYSSWKTFRESEDARYVALTLPRVLGRLPYGEKFKGEKFKRVGAFSFEELLEGADHGKYPWMSAAWAYAARVTDAFAKYGWFARTRGVEGGGKVEGLPTQTFPTDDGGVALRCPTEIAISERREVEFSSLGFLPLLHVRDQDFAAFLGAQSCQQPKAYPDATANANAELTAKLNYTMCVSRFMHYLKVLAHHRLGVFMDVKDCEHWLNDWIHNYVLANPNDASEAARARMPLAEAHVELREARGRPGQCDEIVLWARPHHYQFEAFSNALRVVAKVPRGQ